MFKFGKGIEPHRLDANRIQIGNQSDTDILLFANPDVPIDNASLDEVACLAELDPNLAELQSHWGIRASIERIVLTPDFHKGAGIPVGSVIKTKGAVFPRAIGNDIGCGMRAISLGIDRKEFLALGEKLDVALRHAFFEGGRDIAMTERTREACLRSGVAGLAEFPGEKGIWQRFDTARFQEEIESSHNGGSWTTKDSWNFGDFIRGSGGLSRDASIATIGGGNHFVEFGWASQCLNRKTCWEWGTQQDQLTLMVHTGSLDIGASVGSYFCQKARDLWPKNLPAAAAGFYPLPTEGEFAEWGEAYLSAMGLAANFAICNRLMLGELAVSVIERVMGRTVESKLIYDAPHNVIWSEGSDHIHRKGACPADYNEEHSRFFQGHPVIVPGSMGDKSYLLRSLGNSESLWSAPHGAGRKTTRGEGRKANAEELSSVRVVTSVDFNRIRPDIAQELRKKLLEEAPSQYKPVLPAMQTVRDAGIAEPVVELSPLLTIKS